MTRSRFLKLVFFTVSFLVLGILVYTGVAAYHTGQTIAEFKAAVRHHADDSPSPAYHPQMNSQVPAVVARYFHFAFPASPQAIRSVRMEMSGEFRRPQMTSFSPATAEQVAAAGTPAMVFKARTPILPGLWATAYDAYIGGKMEMKAKLLSAVTVMTASPTPELNRISLARWLAESPLYPTALLPGRMVRWEPVDAHRARAVVSAYGTQASMVATFRDDGSLERFDAEADGDLTTPYHGSGEVILRDDYQEVDGMMIPMSFSIARAAKGKTYPFWIGTVDRIAYEMAQE
jgi:hypothetical protein